jgi:hypothetical protein
MKNNTRSEKYAAHKNATAILLAQPATTSRKKAILIVKNAEGRLMAEIENGRLWGGRRGVKQNGGKAIAKTEETVAAMKTLRANASAWFPFMA